MPKQEKSARVEGVIIRHTNYGEADRFLTIFTREKGKIQTVAKGIRKSRSRKAGHVEPFTRVRLQLAQGRDLFILTQAEAIDVFPAIRENLILIGYASYIIELVDRSIAYDEDNRELYILLIQTLTRLNTGDDPKRVSRYFEIRLLDLIGFRPQLISCARCDSKIQPEDQFFSAVYGGVICPKCGLGDPQVKPITMSALKYFRYFQRSSYQEIARATIPTAIYTEMENIMQYYITYSLERNLNSPAFLRHVRYTHE